MADKDTPIYDKNRMRGTTWVDATRILFNMGSELEEQVDGMDYERVKQEIDTLGTQVNQNKSDITQIKETINQIEDNATALGASVAELQTDVIEAQADIEGIKTSLVSDVITKGGITTGTIVVEIEKEDGTKITAEDFNYGKPTSMELLQGSSEGMMKAQFTLSDGTTIQSNDFQVLEMVTGDLYITSFTFKNGSSQGKISADIGLSDGRTLEANDFQLPTDPQVTQNIASLLSRMTAVEKKNSQQDTELSSLDERVKAIEDTPGVGKFELGKLGTIMGSSDNGKISANPDGTGSVNGWDSVASADDISDLQEQITAITISTNVSQDSSNVIKVSNAVNGNSADLKLDLAVVGTDIVLTAENADGTQQATTKIAVGDIPFDPMNAIPVIDADITYPQDMRILHSYSSPISISDVNETVVEEETIDYTIANKFNVNAGMYISTFVSKSLINVISGNSLYMANKATTTKRTLNSINVNINVSGSDNTGIPNGKYEVAVAEIRLDTSPGSGRGSFGAIVGEEQYVELSVNGNSYTVTGNIDISKFNYYSGTNSYPKKFFSGFTICANQIRKILE